MQHADVAVIGGGIVGLAFADAAARRGHSVVLFERTTAAQGASVRNFGMIWPIGQPPGPLYRLALQSRNRWMELGRTAGIGITECGSLHLAYEADERAVLEEFAAKARSLQVEGEYLASDEVARRFPSINADRLQGALYSSREACIDPRQVIDRFPRWLAETHSVTLRFGTAVTDISLPRVRTAAGEVWQVGRAFVCSGIDFATLFPQVFAAAGLSVCKLQMMRTNPQPGGWRLGPHIAGGLTLCHYRAFEVCRSLPALKQRVAADFTEYAQYGIHVMAAQNSSSEVLIGDSHEYNDSVSPFDNSRIDELILDYLRRMVKLPDARIAARWHGAYAKHPTQPLLAVEPQPRCTVVAGVGGAGMTMAFGYAEAWWNAHEHGRVFDPAAVETTA